MLYHFCTFGLAALLVFPVIVRSSPVDLSDSVLDLESRAAADDLALLLINSFRAQHQNTPAVTYDTNLAFIASLCAEDRAVTGDTDPASWFPCTAAAANGYGETINVNAAPNAIDGIRDAISHTDPTIGWFGGYLQRGNDFFFGYDRATHAYSQMIWASTTSVGCAYSVGTTGGSHVLTCLWQPAGNVPALYTANVNRENP